MHSALCTQDNFYEMTSDVLFQHSIDCNCLYQISRMFLFALRNPSLANVFCFGFPSDENSLCSKSIYHKVFSIFIRFYTHSWNYWHHPPKKNGKIINNKISWAKKKNQEQNKSTDRCEEMKISWIFFLQLLENSLREKTKNHNDGNGNGNDNDDDAQRT